MLRFVAALALGSLLLGTCAGCARLQAFQQQFEKGFLYKPLMRQATNLDEVVPSFAWADHASEGVTSQPTGGGGGGGCPT